MSGLSSDKAGRRAEAGTSHAIDTDGRIGPPFVLTQGPDYWDYRSSVFDTLKQAQFQNALASDDKDIAITLPNGDTKTGKLGKTCPLDIALEISNSLAKAVVVAKVTYSNSVERAGLVVVDEDEEDEPRLQQSDQSELWDLTRPLEGDCQLLFLKCDDPEGQHVFWHSSAHVLGQALESKFGAHLTTGPALTRGFYYDCYMGTNVVSRDDYDALQKEVETFVQQKQPFERLVVSKQEALQMFKHNPFKVQIISNKIPDDGRTTVYRCGKLIDLCRGPHIPNTGLIKAFAIEKHSSAYWLGKTSNDSLQRVYAISFTDAKKLKQHFHFIEEAKRRDHRLLGTTLDLFFFDANASPGSCFWLPDGLKIFNKLCDLMRNEYRFRGFEEVLSPNIYASTLFHTSGHMQNYKENMFLFDVEGKTWGLKPMNCPGHCILFKHLAASYRQLPIRFAEFGVLHRNELTGSLAGLTRVRRFQQDDAHVFCRVDQIEEECKAALDFVFFIYKLFGFTYEMKLGTRPAKALGDEELWDTAEKALARSLDASNCTWSYNHGDGAFYGPKIDFRLQDALNRWHQCGTLQLDFNLPKRFNLSYRTEEVALKKEASNDPPTKNPPSAEVPSFPTGEVHPPASTSDHHETPKGDGSLERELLPGHARPVMIHRAILGSLERFIAILIEHTGGKLPFWLSPRQVMICTVSDKFNEYGEWVRKILNNYGYYTSMDDRQLTVNKKIREAQLAQWNYMIVVGERERADRTVTLRPRDDSTSQKTLTLKELLDLLNEQGMPSSVNKLESFADLPSPP